MKRFNISAAFLIMFFAINLLSQNTTFEYLLSTNSDEFIFDIVEGSDNNIYYSGHFSTPDSPNHKSGLIVKLDKYGYHIDSVHISNTNRSISINRIFLRENGGFITVASLFDSATSYKKSGIYFSNLDTMLSLSEQRIYNFPDSLIYINLDANLVTNGNIFVGVALRMPIAPKSYIYKFNTNFDSLNAKFYSNGSRAIRQINEIHYGNLWFLNGLLNQYEIVDSTLEMIVTVKIPNHLNGNFGLKWDTDTSFYLLGADNSGNNLAFIRQFHPVDTTGHLYSEWRVSDTIDFPALWNGLDFQNKDSIFIGGTRNMWLGYYNPWPSWFVVLQTDSMLNIRWERFYGGDAYYMMGKVVATHDGGCLVAGTRYDYLHTTEQETDIIILKLNSEGLILGTPENPGIKMHEAIVYPNPGNEEIKVRIAIQYPQSTFELFDMNGQFVLRENFIGPEGLINTTFLPQGTYLYKITSPDGLNESGKWVKR